MTSEIESLPAAACVPLALQERDTRPLAVDLYCGLGGWAEGFLAEGFRVVGFDNGHTAPYAAGAKYPGQLVIQDVLTIHGSQFKCAAVIVASPPCQNYSYLAMPWSRSTDIVRPDGDGWEVLNSADAKLMREKWEREGPDNRLFDACFRIQREAIEATGHDCPACFGLGPRHPGHVCPKCNGTCWVTRYIPLIVENVRGAIPWVGRSAWNYGSFHLWGDVPALMPIQKRGWKGGDGSWFAVANNTNGHSKNPVHELAGKKGLDAIDRSGEVPEGTGNSSWFFQGKRRDPQDIRRDGNGDWATIDGTKIGGDWFSDPNSTCRKHGSRSNARRMASAMIAKIPLPLAQHIAAVYKPRLPVFQGGRLADAGGGGTRR